MGTLYQSYYPISHTPPLIPLQAHPRSLLYTHTSLSTRSPHSISPPKRRPPSPPFSFYFRHIHSFSHSLTSRSLNVPKPLQHLSIHSSSYYCIPPSPSYYCIPPPPV